MSASLIGWLLTLLLIIVVASGFFIGFWRGLKRSTASLVISIVGMFVAFFITPAITKAVLGIQINMDGETVALQDVLIKYVMSIQEVGTLVEKNPNLETFFMNLPTALVNVVLLIVVALLVQGIMYIIYKILACTILKNKPEQKKRRISGGIVGAVKSFVVLLFVFMPLASLIGVANTCTNSGDYGINAPAQTASTQMTANAEETQPEGEATGGENSGETAGENSGLIPQNVQSVISGLENNLLTKMCGMFGLDNALFDYYGSFDLNGEKIVIRQEIINVYNVIDITSQLSQVDSTYSFKDFNYQKITKAFNSLSESPMFENILADTIGEIIINYKDYSFIANSQFAKDNAQILDALSLGLKAYTEAGGSVSDYFTEDIKKLVSVATSFGQNGTIDEIVALEPIDVDGAIQVLTNDTNYETTKTNLEVLFSMNLIRDGAEEIVKSVANKLSDQLDPIGVSTEAWTDEDWDSLSNSILSVCKRYANISQKVDIMKVVEDPTMLLDSTKNYDIAGILSELGQLIDEARGVNLLQTSENKPIIDKLLSSYNIPIPVNGKIAEVVANDGTAKTLTTHKKLLEFIAPSLVSLRDEGIYDTIMAEGETNSKLISLAQIISKEGNSSILSDIILPLYQVEPTKTLIINKVTNGLASDLIDLTTLNTYAEWKNDLGYISNMLITLNSKKVGDETYLQLALNDKLDTIIDNLAEEDVDAIIKPVFYAKSTDGVKQKIATKIKNDLILFTFETNLTFTINGKTFVEGANEDQTGEFCDVLKKLLPLKSAYLTALGDLKKVDKALLGNMMTSMQANAYRVEISSKTEEGIFKGAFISLMTKFKSSYQTEITALESAPDTLEQELGIRSFAEENYSKINFGKLMTMLAQLEA